MATKRIKRNRYRRRDRKLALRTLIVGLKTIAAGAGALVLSILFVFCHDVFTQWDAFAVKKITLAGNQRLSQAEICDRSQIQIGANIFAVNLTAARKSLRSHPWVAEAHIQREIPDGIHFRIREHRAVAVIDLGRKFLLDDTGVLFKELESNDIEKLPVVCGLRYSDVVPGGAAPFGQRPPAQPADEARVGGAPFDALVAILGLGNEDGSALPNRLIDRIEVDRETGITVHMAEGLKTVKLGFGEFPEKYALLQRLLTYLAQRSTGDWQGVETVDLNNLKRIVVQPLTDPETDTGRTINTDGGSSNVS